MVNVQKKKFKNTEFGLIPVDWEMVSFKGVCKIVSGQVDPKKEPYCNMPHIGNANIAKMTGKLLHYKTAKEDQQTSGKYLFNENHVLYGKINPQFAKVTFPKLKGLCSADIYPIETDRNKLEPLYLKYLLLDSRFIQYAVSLSGRTGIPKINRGDLEGYRFAIPSVTEQYKITSIISSVDEVIEKTETIIEQAEKVKRGLIQQLLTKGIGHEKFKKTKLGLIPEEWDVKKLGEVVAKQKYAIVDGPFGSSINTSRDYIDSGIPVIRTVNIRPFKFIEEDLKYISEDLFGKLDRSAVYPDDILLSKVGTIGYACILPIHVEKAILSTTGSCKITVNKSIISNQFLCYVLNNMKPYMDKLASEGVQPFLNMTTIKGFDVVVPPLNEQERIVDILNSISDKINSEHKKLDNLILLKKGLMQSLLTGEVRVNVEVTQV